MKRIIFSLFIIISAFSFSASAQTAARQAFEKGIKAANGGNYETALGEFKNALAFVKNEDASDDFRAKIHFNIGASLYRLERNAEAVEELEEAIRLNRNYEKAFYALGMAESGLQNWREAERAFLEVIRLNRRNGEAWFDLAFVYLAQKNTDAARGAFEKSIEYKSVSSSVSHNNLGVLLAINGDVKSAMKEFEIAISKSGGKFPEAERNLQFCKALGQNSNYDLSAELKFSK